ncbi:hypothetical protein KC354_g94 [Hortaea werneckii]|nr:hypothetical protein KC354_g94 [Hortaea werneckii]
MQLLPWNTEAFIRSLRIFSRVLRRLPGRHDPTSIVSNHHLDSCTITSTPMLQFKPRIHKLRLSTESRSIQSLINGNSE